MEDINSVKLSALGDSAIIIEFSKSIDLQTHHKVKALAAYLDEHPFPGMIEYITAFTTVTVFYDPLQVYNIDSQNRLNKNISNYKSPYFIVESIMKEILLSVENDINYKPRIVEIPVCYGGEFGPDLEYVAKHNRLTIEEVINIHSSGEYLVYMIGFAPGFPYLGGMSERIAAPRRQSPRLLIPAGTVGIAGKQTGVYPIGTPGGWQLIGRTPLALFRPKDDIPSLLRSGDIIKFKSISHDEYNTWKEEFM
ncbi:kinase A inhibitor [Clostridium polyendosporum]|uniref:Kinase A inhibitor n=1 Tax=Clostridium polyendosporum TaxID=69208 RepID=A0A919VFD7_9CLOT|nr:5-oxoprolinase subunit PxpB [Clostridium polyendosporum]GIM28037.1 kinase A inhibitor [Clostridium polyendosporum]